MTKLLDLKFTPITFGPFGFGPEASAAFAAVHKAVRPGAVLLFSDGVAQLVGHVNPLMGVCDDCREYRYEDVVAIAYLDIAEDE